MYSRECIEQIRRVADLRDILVSYGDISPSSIQDSSDEIRCRCPIHMGDNLSGFSWKKSTGLWKCFTQNCGTSGDHDIFGFLRLKLGITFKEAIELLAERYGVPLVEEDNPDTENTEYLNKNNLTTIGTYKRRYQQVDTKVLNRLPGYSKEGFPTVFKYLDTRGYKYKDIKCFNLYPFLDFNNLLRLGIPVYNENNQLIGINARLMNTVIDYPETVTNKDGYEVSVSKYKMTKFKKGQVLYNLNNAKNYSISKGLIIVEGQLDIIRLYTYGIYNAVCTMGTTLTAQQVALLYKHCYHVIFLIEEGEAAIQGVSHSIKELRSGMKVSIAKLPSGDADNNPRHIVLETLKNLKTLNNKELGLLSNGIYTI